MNLLYDVHVLRKKYDNADKHISYIGKAGEANSKLSQSIRQSIKNWETN